MTRWWTREFDPSGHIFLVGVQLVPLWAARAAAAQSAVGTRRTQVKAASGAADADVLRYATYAEPLLWWVSAGTAAFYHSAADVAAAWVLVAGLAAAVVVCAPAAARSRSNDAAPQADSPVEAPSNAVDSPSSSARVVALAALVIWTIETFILCSASGVLRRAPWMAAMHALYDALVALAALRLSATIS